MRKLLLSLLLIAALPLAGTVYAQEFESNSTRAGNNVFISPDELIDGPYFASGDTVTVSGTINGDLYVAGGTVIIDGIVNGDLLAAGGVVNVIGEISQDVRVAGGQVNISGEIKQNITLAGGNLDISPAANVGGSLVAVGGNLLISSPISGNLNAAVGNLTISRNILGDIESAVGNFTLTPSAVVDGRINYWSEQEINIAEGASVSGTITKNDPKRSFQGVEGAELGAEAATEAFLTTGRIMLFLSLLLIGLLTVRFAPNFTERTSKVISEAPLKSGLIGLIALVLTPLIVGILIITLLGVPLGLIMIATYLIYLYISRIFFIYWLGEYGSNKLNKKASKLWLYFFGTLIYAIIALIPIIGGVFKFFALLLGLGALLISWKETYTKMQKSKLL